jgi:alpha-1,2-mannosyltransferase
MYMDMGEAAFEAPGHRIYAQLFFVEHKKFIYPPSSLFLTQALHVAPRAGVSSKVAMATLVRLSWVAVLVLGVLVYRGRRGGVTWMEAACLVVFGLLFLPVAEGLYRGQVQTILTALWGAAALLWMYGKKGWAGVALAVSCAFKPQMALFALWGATRKEWRFTGALLGVVLGIEACAVVRFGLRNNLDYVAVLSYLSRHGEALWANQSVNGLMNRLLRNGDASEWSSTVYPPYNAVVYAASTVATAVAVGVGLALPWRGRWMATTADFLLFGCLATMASPIAWEHHYSVFYFPLVYLLARAGSLSKAQWGVLCVAVLAMSNRLPPLDAMRQGGAALAGAYLLYAGVAVMVVLVLAQAELSRGLRCKV